MRVLVITGCICIALALNAQTCDSGKLDPRIAAVLRDSIRDLSPSARIISIEQIKEGRLKTASSYPVKDMRRIQITQDSIPLLIYNAVHKTGLPIIIYFHPGGFVTPLLPWMERDGWKISSDYQAIVVAVDYRIAPEHPYPAAVNDAYNTFNWVIRNGAAYGGDTNNIILFGQSAGANLAAVICQKAKRDGLGHKIRLQILNCPSLDDIRDYVKHPSYQKYATGYFLTKAFLLYAQQLYAGERNFDNPEVAPLLTPDLKGLPPAVMITAEFDILRDEDMEYAKRLQQAGVKVWHKCFPGQIHCLVGLPEDADELRKLRDLVKMAINECLTRQTAPSQVE